MVCLVKPWLRQELRVLLPVKFKTVLPLVLCINFSMSTEEEELMELSESLILLKLDKLFGALMKAREKRGSNWRHLPRRLFYKLRYRDEDWHEHQVSGTVELFAF